MGIGPVPAIRKMEQKSGFHLTDFVLVELNEAFAVQVLACDRDLHFDRQKLNFNGGAIALGHPIGCTGTRIAVTLLHEMLKRKARRGLATLCVSGGAGMGPAILNSFCWKGKAGKRKGHDSPLPLRMCVPPFMRKNQCGKTAA